MRKASILFLLTLSALSIAANSLSSILTSNEYEHLKINQLQILGTHNSYALPIDPNLSALINSRVNALFAQISKRNSSLSLTDQNLLLEEHPHPIDFIKSREYVFPPLKEQLDYGLRSLELDLYNDPQGGIFDSPQGYKELSSQGITDLLPFNSNNFQSPGLKVMHIPDVDFRSHCPTFIQCLQELLSWSEENQNHEPIFILLELKTRALPVFSEQAKVFNFDESAYKEIHRSILSVLGIHKLITPSNLKGNYSSINEAVLAHNWPTLEEARGKFIFLLISAGDLRATNDYFSKVPVKDQLLFPRSTPGDPNAAFLMFDNAIIREDEIKQRVVEGYLIRTRADIDTWEARNNSHDRSKAAFRSGAQIISTDYYQPGNSFNTDYFVKMPNSDILRMSPVFK
jgi:hypothetical protein